MNLDDCRSLFPVTERYVYLNNAADGPPPAPVTESMLSMIEDNHFSGCMNFRQWLQVSERCRARFASLINCTPSEVAFVKNTTQGIIIAAQAVPIKKADIILVNDMEFPANVLPWLTVARQRGAQVRIIPSKVGRVTPEMIAAAMNRQVRVLALSSVQYENGFMADLRRIGEICEENCVYFVVDAIQSCGVMPIDVRTSKISLLCAGGHKWLLSIGGAGFLYVSSEIQEDLLPANTGWLGNREPLDFRQTIDPAPGARRYEEGNPNMVGIFGLDASLALIEELGVENIANHVRGLNSRLVAGLESKGYRVESPQSDKERSAITLFRGGPLSARQLKDVLAEAGVVIAVRSRGIRVSPHCFNNVHDIDRLLNALP